MYDSDLNESQWAHVAPLLPDDASRGRRPRRHSGRVLLDAIRYVTEHECTWRELPDCYPPWQTVYAYYTRWRADGTLDRVSQALTDVLGADGNPDGAFAVSSP